MCAEGAASAKSGTGRLQIYGYRTASAGAISPCPKLQDVLTPATFSQSTSIEPRWRNTFHRWDLSSNRAVQTQHLLCRKHDLIFMMIVPNLQLGKRRSVKSIRSFGLRCRTGSSDRRSRVWYICLISTFDTVTTNVQTVVRTGRLSAGVNMGRPANQAPPHDLHP